jgi:hypothetical protein
MARSNDDKELGQERTAQRKECGEHKRRAHREPAEALAALQREVEAKTREIERLRQEIAMQPAQEYEEKERPCLNPERRKVSKAAQKATSRVGLLTPEELVATLRDPKRAPSSSYEEDNEEVNETEDIGRDEDPVQELRGFDRDGEQDEPEEVSQ